MIAAFRFFAVFAHSITGFGLWAKLDSPEFMAFSGQLSGGVIAASVINWSIQQRLLVEH
jgi:hypothetical protein